MKTWLISVVALALLAGSPPAFAAPDSATQQDQHKDKKADTGRSSGNAGNRDSNNATNSNHRTVHDRKVVKTRHVVVKRPVVVHKDVRVNRRVDVSSLRRNFNAPHRFHWNAYHRPAGWYAHRWTYGERLPRAWFARNYWISSFAMFSLTAPPDGYVWVRVGDDALLIDEDSGEVVQVVYGVFY